jgi:hypothetical protein
MVSTERRAALWIKASYLLIAVLVMLLIGVLGQSARLTCRREFKAEPVTCVRQLRTFWVIPLGNQEIDHVVGAILSEGGGPDCGMCYGVELITSHGKIPLSSVYTSGSADKINVVNQINEFVSDTQAGALVVTEPGVLSMENIVYSAVWVFIILIWTALKKAFRQGRPA